MLGLASFFSVALGASSSAEQHWPQWRGPLQNGVAPHADPPTEWSETKNIKWKVKIPGEGASTPVIWENKVFVLTAIPTGKKVEPKPDDAASGEQNPRPPGAGTDQPGQSRAGPDGRGGPGGFGPGNLVGQQMLSAGDKNSDRKLSREEFSALAGAWFEKLDPDKEGKLSQIMFGERFGTLMPQPAEPSPGGRGGGPGRFMAPGFFGATDANKDGSLTRDEFTSTFAKWFTEWDADKSGALTDEKLREGLNAALPRPQLGGQGGRGGPGGRGGQKPTEFHQFVILCLDRQTGKVLWQQTAREEVPHEGFRQGDGSFASTSPITDGRHVFAHFGSRGLYCYDLEGKLLWSEDLGDMRISNTFGEGSSPALYKNTLIVNWDNEGESFIVALDKNTGKTLWKNAREERTSWSTPLVVEHEGKPQVVTVATSRIRSYDLSAGKLIWECAGLTRNVIPCPVSAGGMLYAMSGFQGNALLAIHLGRTGDLTGTDAIAWTHKKSTPYVPSPLLYGNNLYFFAGNNGMLSCFDIREGKALIDAERIDGLQGVYASPVGAKGRVYLTGRNGVTVVIKQSDKLEMLATNQLDDKFDASLAVVGKDLLLRGREHLYCISEK